MDNNLNMDASVNVLETELQNLIDEMLRSPPQNPLANFSSLGSGESLLNTLRTNNITNNEYIGLLEMLRDIIVVCNSNISEYNSNMANAMQILQNIFNIRQITRDLTTSPSTPPSMQLAPRNNNNHLFSYVLYRPTIQQQETEALRRFFQNIVIRPTPEQIDAATELITYNRNMENIGTCCPITLDDFQDGDLLRQVRHCRHTFNEAAIQSWFQSNVRCPVCRYDIREYTVGTGSRDNTTDPSPPENVFNPNPIVPVPSMPLPLQMQMQMPSLMQMPMQLPMQVQMVPNSSDAYHDTLRSITQNFAAEINNLLSNNFRPDINNGRPDVSQNFVFDVHVETNI